MFLKKKKKKKRKPIVCILNTYRPIEYEKHIIFKKIRCTRLGDKLKRSKDFFLFEVLRNSQNCIICKILPQLICKSSSVNSIDNYVYLTKYKEVIFVSLQEHSCAPGSFYNRRTDQCQCAVGKCPERFLSPIQIILHRILNVQLCSDCLSNIPIWL